MFHPWNIRDDLTERYPKGFLCHTNPWSNLSSSMHTYHQTDKNRTGLAAPVDTGIPGSCWQNIGPTPGQQVPRCSLNNAFFLFLLWSVGIFRRPSPHPFQYLYHSNAYTNGPNFSLLHLGYCVHSETVDWFKPMM